MKKGFIALTTILVLVFLINLYLNSNVKPNTEPITPIVKSPELTETEKSISNFYEKYAKYSKRDMGYSEICADNKTYSIYNSYKYHVFRTEDKNGIIHNYVTNKQAVDYLNGLPSFKSALLMTSIKKNTPIKLKKEEYFVPKKFLMEPLRVKNRYFAEKYVSAKKLSLVDIKKIRKMWSNMVSKKDVNDYDDTLIDVDFVNLMINTSELLLDNGKMDKSVRFLSKSIECVESLDNDFKFGIYEKISNVFKLLDDEKNAVNYLNESLKYSKNLTHKAKIYTKMADTHQYFGNNFESANMYIKASSITPNEVEELKYFSKAMGIYKEEISKQQFNDMFFDFITYKKDFKWVKTVGKELHRNIITYDEFDLDYNVKKMVKTINRIDDKSLKSKLHCIATILISEKGDTKELEEMFSKITNQEQKVYTANKITEVFDSARNNPPKYINDSILNERVEAQTINEYYNIAKQSYLRGYKEKSFNVINQGVNYLEEDYMKYQLLKKYGSLLVNKDDPKCDEIYRRALEIKLDSYDFKNIKVVMQKKTIAAAVILEVMKNLIIYDGENSEDINKRASNDLRKAETHLSLTRYGELLYLWNKKKYTEDSKRVYLRIKRDLDSYVPKRYEGGFADDKKFGIYDKCCEYLLRIGDTNEFNEFIKDINYKKIYRNKDNDNSVINSALGIALKKAQLTNDIDLYFDVFHHGLTSSNKSISQIAFDKIVDKLSTLNIEHVDKLVNCVGELIYINKDHKSKKWVYPSYVTAFVDIANYYFDKGKYDKSLNVCQTVQAFIQQNSEKDYISSGIKTYNRQINILIKDILEKFEDKK